MAEAREAGNFALPDFARARPRRVLPVLGDGDARTDAAAGSSSKYAAENRVGFDRSYPEFPKNSSTTPRQIHLSSIPSPILEIDDRSMEPHRFTLV